MENLRFFLFALFVLLGYQLWLAWQQDYGQKGAISKEPPKKEERAALPPNHIEARTDVLRLEIDLNEGGDIQVADLLAYPVSKEKPDQPVRLLTDQLPKLHISQTGFIDPSRRAPTHKASWQSQKRRYHLQEGAEELLVPLVWQGEGLTIEKGYRLRRGSYEVVVDYRVVNRSQAPLELYHYGQLKRKRPKSKSRFFVRAFQGIACHTEEDPFEKYRYNQIEPDRPIKWETKGGWCAMMQHHFISAWLPPSDWINHFYLKALPEETYLAGSYGPRLIVAPGEEKRFQVRFYLGPKLQDVLPKVAPGLELTVDYGVFTFLAKPLFWLLSAFHRLLGNWGLAIIAVTFVIRLLLYPLAATSFRSMAKMRKLQPKLQELKEKYGDDKARFQQEMLKLYREEKINPFGGCLPILLQIPIFISLYWVLAESVELRQAEFLWIPDLTAADPYFLLPIIMGVSMWLQQKLSPQPTDPVQAQMVQVFPIVFTIFFAFFPAGLVLYWTVNNLFSILQQWWIYRQLEQEGLK